MAGLPVNPPTGEPANPLTDKLVSQLTMVENISPEEKLFRIIQNGKNTSPEAKDVAATQMKKNPSGIKQFLATFNPLRRPTAKMENATSAITHSAEHTAGVALPMSLRPADLKTINKLLVLLLFIVIAVAFYYLSSRKPMVSDIISEISDVPFERKEKKVIEVFKPLGFYLETARKRDILRPAQQVREEVVLPEEEPPEERLRQLASSLTLQGISWGKVPKAMIKDSTDGQVYFVRIGQKIGATDIVIKEITKDRVVISYGDEEMELL